MAPYLGAMQELGSRCGRQGNVYRLHVGPVVDSKPDAYLRFRSSPVLKKMHYEHCNMQLSLCQQPLNKEG